MGCHLVAIGGMHMVGWSIEAASALPLAVSSEEQG